MRSLLSLVALCALSSVPLRADTFDITFSGTLSGSGTFTTDGICTLCSPDFSHIGVGLLSLTINIDRDSGPNAFDFIDDPGGSDGTVYRRAINELCYSAINSENTSDGLNIIGAIVGVWDFHRPGLLATGTVSITPAVPEPNSLFLVTPILAIVGLRWRHQRHRV